MNNKNISWKILGISNHLDRVSKQKDSLTKLSVDLALNDEKVLESNLYGF
ncbi:MAG: hypothetical protein H7644_04680 [Candidatus Heimdallarchaeota archaeon]|nr:hypothetical protein [Candidatus Heimdallarchaeota archaeon]